MPSVGGEERDGAMGVLGFHFRFQLRVDWRGVAPVFDERAKLLGCPAPGGTLRPRAERATISGTIDHRLRQGGLRYDFVLYDRDGLVVDVQLGRTGEPVGIHFGVDPRTSGDWCSRDTLRFSSAGLFVPEQRTADNTRTLPAAFVARVDLWTTLSGLAAIGAGAPVPESLELPSAPGWKFLGASNNLQPELSHPLAGLSFTITPMAP